MKKEITKKYSTSLIAVDAFVNEHKIIIDKQEVLLIEDAAKLLEVSLAEIKQVIQNEPARFPSDFIFVAKRIETDTTVCVVSMAGLFMLAGQLRTDRADKISVQLIELLVAHKPNIGFDLVMGKEIK